MNLKKLSFALACGLVAGQAGAAVSLDAHGLGQGLLYPYFTTNNGQTTLINIQNTASQGKALKVRILESHAGAETLTFNIYLPPFGQWGGALTLLDGGTGSPPTPAALVPSATNAGCTLPALAAEGTLTRTFGFDGDSGPQGTPRTREGSVEIIEMGTLDEALTALIKSGSDADCGTLVSRAQTGGIWTTNESAGIEAPTGKLRGSAVLVNVAGGTSFEYQAVGFNGLATTQRHNPIDISEQGLTYAALTPRLTDIQTVDNAAIEVDVMTTAGAATLRYPSDRGHDAIGALLATTQAFNVFNTHPGLRSRTEWIVSLPTRRAHVQNLLVGVPPSGVLLTPPFLGIDCDTVPVVAWNTKGTKIDATTPVELCESASVIRFDAEGETLDPLVADHDAETIVTAATEGAARLDFRKFGEDGVRAFAPDLDGNCVLGLPAWVMSVQSFDNDNAQDGRIATYPVSNVASGPVEIVDCDSLDD
jgi:hypothetical protein